MYAVKGGECFLIGISSACYYPMPTEDAFSMIAKSKTKICELFFNTSSEIEGPFLRQLKAVADNGGFSVGSVHPFSSFAETNCFFSAYERRTRESIDFYKRFFNGGAELGAEFFVFHGAVLGAALDPEFYAERFYTLSQAAKAEGITLCQENVSRCLAGRTEYVRKLKELLGNNISFVLDIKQAHRAECDPFEMAKAMRDSLKLVHVNDFNSDSDCLLPGKGTFDLKGLKSLLDEMGYSGNFIIEVYRQNYGDYSEVEDSFRTLEQLFLKR